MNLIPKTNRDLFSDLHHEVDSVFSRFSPDCFRNELGTFFGDTESSFNPVIDLHETDDAVHVRAEIPGLEKDHISLDINNQTLTLSGEKKRVEEKKEKNYYRKESSYGKFSRQIVLPAEVDSGKSSADYKNGVLNITLPKTVNTNRKKIEVKVN